MHQIADAIRNVTATMQRRFDNGERSSVIDLHDLVEALLAIADEIGPPFGQGDASHGAAVGEES